MSLHSFTIKSILKRNAKIFPDKIALEDGNIQTTYKELFQQVQALAAGLKAEGMLVTENRLWLCRQRVGEG